MKKGTKKIIAVLMVLLVSVTAAFAKQFECGYSIYKTEEAVVKGKVLPEVSVAPFDTVDDFNTWAPNQVKQWVGDDTLLVVDQPSKQVAEWIAEVLKEANGVVANIPTITHFFFYETDLDTLVVLIYDSGKYAGRRIFLMN